MRGLLTLFKRLGNPLDWCPVDKAVLCILITIPMLVSWEVWRQFMLASPLLQYVNAGMLRSYGAVFQGVILLSLALSAVGLLLRRQAAAQRFFPFLALQFYALSLCYFGYLIGSLSVATGLVMAGGPLVGFILFPRRTVYPALLAAIGVIAAVSYAGATGALPYAPLFATAMPHSPEAGKVWFYSMVYFSVPQLVSIVLLGDFVMRRWHRRELEVRHLSLTDALTGVRNRRSIMEFLAQEVARSRRAGAPLSVVMVDLDHFKHINDRWGHTTGDRALKAAAHVLMEAVRTTDGVGRYGGEEFMLVLTDTDRDGAHVLAERCRRMLEQVVVPAENGEQLHVTASLGLYCNIKDPGLDADSLIRFADDALYRAKDSGRNRVVLA
ncbi:MAG TPA: GGDEF domain-containing protein [Moraxellaceae bacterium]